MLCSGLLSMGQGKCDKTVMQGKTVNDWRTQLVLCQSLKMAVGSFFQRELTIYFFVNTSPNIQIIKNVPLFEAKCQELLWRRFEKRLSLEINRNSTKDHSNLKCALILFGYTRPIQSRLQVQPLEHYFIIFNWAIQQRVNACFVNNSARLRYNMWSSY